MEPMSVDKDVDEMYNPTKWSMGLRGTARLLRCLQLYEIQNQNIGLTGPIEHVAYGPDERQGLNVMRCSGTRQNDTMLVFIHGGYWIEGDRHMHNFVARGMHLHNISVITLGYRLATKGSGLDNCVDDVVLGIEKIQETFPTSNIFLAGHSAGGHLLMAALPRLASLQGIRKVFSVSGIYSLWEVMHTSVGVQVGFTKEQCEKYSITPHPCYDIMDLQLVVSQYDPPGFRKQAEHFAASMQRKRFRKKFVQIIPNEDHFSLVENLFFEKAALTLIFAGSYSPNRRPSKL